MLVSTQWAAVLDRLSGVTPVLLTMTLAASIAALVVMALRLVLRKVPRKYFFALWCVVLVRMFSPFGYGLGFVSLIPEPVTSGRVAEYILEAGGVGAEAPAPASSVQMTDIPPNPDGALAGPITVAEDPDWSEEKHIRIPVTPAMVIPVIWLAGVAGMLLWSAAAYLRIRRRMSEAVMVSPGIYESDAIDTPFVLNADIYLPVGLSEEDRRFVLLHEQAHIDHTDSLFKGIAWVALSVHWFNPVLWLAYRLMCRDVEVACDQRVIEGFDPTTRREDVAGYAAALFHLGRRERLPQAVLPFGEENAKGRIKTILGYRKPAGWAAALALALCVCVSVGIALNAPAKEEPVGAETLRDQMTAPVTRPDEEPAGLEEPPAPEEAPVPDAAPDTAAPAAAGTDSPAVTAPSGGTAGRGTETAAQDPADALHAMGTTVRRAGPGRDPAAEVQDLFLAAGAGEYLNRNNALVYVQNNEVKVLLTEETPADAEALNRAANLTLNLTDGADTLRIYDRDGNAVVETYEENGEMGQEEFRTAFREETGEAHPIPARENAAPENVDLTPVPAQERDLPDSLNFDFTTQEGAE